MSNLTNSLNKLNAHLEKLEQDSYNHPNKYTTGLALETTDQSELANSLLNEKALLALSKKAYNLVVQVPGTMESYICIYLCVLIKSTNIKKGVELICNSLNTLADKDLIHSTLAKPSSINLAKVFGRAQSSVVYSFVLVPADRKKEAEDLAIYAVDEGTTGDPIENLSVELADGEFLYNASIHIISPYGKRKDVVDKKVKELLSILPEGTEVVSITPCATTGLSFDHEVKLRNPLMNNYKEVKLDYIREAVIVGDKIEQFNLLNSIEYIKKNP